MKQHNPLIVRIFILIYFIFNGIDTSAQISDLTVSDSLRFLPVELTAIPLRSAATLIQTNKILDNLISSDEIAKLKHLNDSILNSVKKENAIFFQGGSSSKDLRFAMNRASQLKYQQETVDGQINQLTDLINKLNESIQYFVEEQEVWSKTKAALAQSSYSGSVLKRIDLVLEALNTAIKKVSDPVEDILSAVDRSSQLKIEIDGYLADQNVETQNLEVQLLQRDHESIFSLKYSAENFKFSEAFKKYIISEWVELKTYLRDKLSEIVLTFILFILFIYLFSNFRKIFIDFQISDENYFKKKIGLILSNPYSAAMVLTLFFTILIFPNRPPAFIHYTTYLALIPIIILMRQLLQKELLFFVYSFTILMILDVIYLILPAENIIFRFSLLFIALADIYLTWYFIFRTIKQFTYSHSIIKLFKTIGYLFFILACFGLFGAIFGNVILAQKVLSAINITIVVSAIFYATVIMINGLLVSLIDSQAVLKIIFFKNYGSLIKRKVVRTLNAAAGFYTFVILLRRLNLWSNLKSGFLEIFTREWSIGEINFSLGTIFIFFIVIYLSVKLGKLIQIILEDDILDKMSLAKGMPHTISVMVKYTLITGGVILAVSAVGMDFSSLTIIIGAFGVGIGFGLQNIFNNLISGLILLFERPVKIGDTIEVGALIGKVTSIGVRASNIKTFDGAEVIVPNGQLISNEVINWTLSDQQRRVEVIIGVSYNSDPHKVYDLLFQILKEHKEIIPFPEPTILFKELGESSLNFRLLFWTISDRWMQIRSEVIFSAFDLLKENNIEIPFPQRDLHIKGFEQQLKVDTAAKSK